MTLFTNLIADLRAFKACDSNRDQMLARDEVAPALMMLGLTPPGAQGPGHSAYKCWLGCQRQYAILCEDSQELCRQPEHAQAKGGQELMATGAGSVLAEAEERQRTRLALFGGSR